MGYLTNGIKEKVEKVGYEMKEFAQDIEIEIRDMREIVKTNAEKLSDEIKKMIMH